MMEAKKKPGLLLLLGKGKPGEENDDKEDDDDDPLAVSDEMIDAVKSFDEAKDAKERAQALKGFIKLCEDY